jgi:hypothetical protein
VATAKSRSAPSSCEDDVRSLSGQYGHVSGLFSCSGGCGMSSKFTTDSAPWRMEVPMQSLPVSPPPITTTCFPAAKIWSGTLSPAFTLFCSGRNSIAKWMPESSRPGTGRSRGFSLPPVRATASNCARRSFGESVTPTCTPVRKVTPSAAICSMRRSIRCFSILKSGMP